MFVNKEMGAVKYIGTTEFADGVWLGVELRKPGECGIIVQQLSKHKVLRCACVCKELQQRPLFTVTRLQDLG